MLRGLLLLAALVAAGAAVASALPAKRLRDGSGTIKLSTSLIQGGGGPVVVSWDGFEFATADDWIGMWCPVPEDWTHTNPTKFIRVKTSAPETWHAGRGSAQFYAVNVRGNCIFQYMTGDEEYPEVLGVSKQLVFANHNYPMGLHIALTNQTGEMRVSWTSASNTRPTVCLSTQSSGDCQQTFGAESSTYTREDMCGSVASGSGFIDPGYLHTSVLTGLQAGTRYYYSVGDSTDSKSWSSKASFVAPNPPGTDDVTKIIAFGDMGQADPLGALQHSFDNNDAGELSSLNTSGFLQQEFATSNPPSLLLHIGDISYAVGFGAEWDQFFHQIEPVAKAFPWMTSIGNHEIGDPKSFIAGTDSQGECGVPYSARFRMPFPADTGRPDKAWYSFQHGLLHIIQMSTEHDFRNGTEQHAWIEEALRAVDRSVTPWVVFTGHRPMYVNDDFDEPVGVMLRDNVEPLLVQYKVDVALWGHNHSYQRMCQLIRGSCVPGAPKHFTIGMAGFSLTGGTGDQPFMEYFNNTVWGFTRITATRTTFMLEFVPNGSSEAMDSFTLHH